MLVQADDSDKPKTIESTLDFVESSIDDVSQEASIHRRTNKVTSTLKVSDQKYNMSASTTNTISALTSIDGLNLLKTGEFSDYKIACGGHVFNVHRNIIATKSEFFAICIKGNFAESASGITQLPEDDPFVVALALLFIYTGESSTEKVIEVWPAIKEAGQALEESTESFLERMIELYKIGHRLLVRDLCQYAEDEMFGRIVQPARPLVSEHPCSFCGCRYNVGSHDHWGSGQPQCDCSQLKEELSEEISVWADHLLLLLRLIFEELPEEPSVRARGVCAALDVTRALPGYGLDVSDDEPSRDIANKASEEISALLEEHDLVAWNVAKRYKRSEWMAGVVGKGRNSWTNNNDVEGDWNS